ncbi:MAG: helix-turn-helix transcriptional regulator [Elusimicrobia bacterium]|nr:helix-turn-helix transcriptional regulator [Elusimicrobiota bacterium]
MGKNPTAAIFNDLKDLRAKQNLTQEDLAKAVGVTRVTINYIENGEYRPSLELAFLLAKFFGKSIEEIFRMDSLGGRHGKNR